LVFENDDLLHRRRPTVEGVAHRSHALERVLKFVRCHDWHPAGGEFLPEHRRLMERGVTAELGHRGQLDRGRDLLDLQPVAARMRLLVEIVFGCLRPVDAHAIAPWPLVPSAFCCSWMALMSRGSAPAGSLKIPFIT